MKQQITLSSTISLFHFFWNCYQPWFLGTVQKNAGKACLVCCLAKPYGVREPQEMEPEADAVSVLCRMMFMTMRGLFQSFYES